MYLSWRTPSNDIREFHQVDPTSWVFATHGSIPCPLVSVPNTLHVYIQAQRLISMLVEHLPWRNARSTNRIRWSFLDRARSLQMETRLASMNKTTAIFSPGLSQRPLLQSAIAQTDHLSGGNHELLSSINYCTVSNSGQLTMVLSALSFTHWNMHLILRAWPIFLIASLKMALKTSRYGRDSPLKSRK